MFNIIAYYVLALPIGISLAFTYDFGLAGLWIGTCLTSTFRLLLMLCLAGQVIALFVVGFAEYAVVWLGTDWEQEVKRGVERNTAEALRQQALVVNDSVRV